MAYPLQPIAFTASATLTRKAHAETMLRANAAAGLTFTLPSATGSGAKFRFYTQTTITSNNLIIQVVGDDIMVGWAQIAQDAADTVVMFETASNSDTITMNGTTTGGIKGDYIELEDVAADTWSVRAWLTGTGTEATPFSAAVT